MNMQSIIFLMKKRTECIFFHSYCMLRRTSQRSKFLSDYVLHCKFSKLIESHINGIDLGMIPPVKIVQEKLFILLLQLHQVEEEFDRLDPSCEKFLAKL